MMEEAPLAPVRSKSFPLQERNTWERAEEERLCQQTRALDIFVKAQEENKEMAQEEQRREEAHKKLLAGLAKGRELSKQLHEHAHEEEMKKSDQDQMKVGITNKINMLITDVTCSCIHMQNLKITFPILIQECIAQPLEHCS